MLVDVFVNVLSNLFFSRVCILVQIFHDEVVRNSINGKGWLDLAIKNLPNIVQYVVSFRVKDL